MSSFGLNEHHDLVIVNYLRFSRFERQQCIKTIKTAFQDAKDTRLLDSTFTLDEVEDILGDISDVVSTEVESELINSSHTNVLLLQQIFKQAEKWHLNLVADLAELENREMLDQVRRLEEKELSSQSMDRPSFEALQPQKRLAPLNEGGPMQLLHLQINEFKDENEKMRSRIRELETQTLQFISEKKQLETALQEEQSKEVVVPEPAVVETVVDQSEVLELNEAFKAVKLQMATELELNAKTQKELEEDLTGTKHQLLEIQHQLNMTEKELEKKFSQTGAYKNMKLMLNTKNDQIKELRKKLKSLNPDGSDPE